jgi:hypothetical protein
VTVKLFPTPLIELAPMPELAVELPLEKLAFPKLY